MPYRACAVSVLAALAPALLPPAASAQYPEQPIRVVLPYAPGAAGDIALRQIQPLLEKRLGQPVVVDYKTGAGGNIGMQDVARAKPDGYTLVLGATNNFVINQYLYRKLGFDPLADLEPVGKLADVPAFVYVSTQVPAADYEQFANYARSHAGKMNYGSPGMGTTPHLSAYRLSKAMGADMTHIAYRGSAPGVRHCWPTKSSSTSAATASRPRTCRRAGSGRWRLRRPKDSPACPTCLLPRRPACRTRCGATGGVSRRPRAHRPTESRALPPPCTRYWRCPRCGRVTWPAASCRARIHRLHLALRGATRQASGKR